MTAEKSTSGGLLARIPPGLIHVDRLQANAVRTGIVVLTIWAAIAVPGFATQSNASSIMYATAAIGIAAVGMALITLSGNLFMLSMGATTAVSTILFASTLHFGLAQSVLLVSLVGLFIGCAQGVAVAFAKANPIIATIAASSIITGFGQYYSGGLTVTGEGDASWLAIGSMVSGIPNQIVIFGVFAILVHIAFERTRLGHELRLVGLNARASEFAWLRARTVLVIAYTVAGIAAALAGALYGSQAAQGNLGLGVGIDFDAIAAVLVGGVAIKGGRGFVIDAAIGALFLALISNILLLHGLSLEVQLVIKGLVVIGSVVFGALAQKVGRQS
ncbi:ABC transporter permease [Rhizobium sp. 18055]|uniref:ABC transporter permease n=1 Tax=Rhizobium sp. 18055 TaxID=2681403 RepID=UPI001FCF0623|nr:ABC transporter permease [Rhizobium sp. 18055]